MRLRAIGIVALLGAALLGGAAGPGAPVAAAGGESPECPRWRRAFQRMPTERLVIETAAGRRVPLAVRVAAVDEARWAGFQCATVEEIRTTLILFDFGHEVLGGFHMRNVPAPLDIAFAKADGRIFSLMRMDPSATETYAPLGPYRYAVEARTGFFAEQGIGPGARLVRPGP
jgi:uncharacterized membrane protein (UPF0127 family)